MNKIKTPRFSGNKSAYLSYFYEALDSYDDTFTFVDLFGGSLALSLAVKEKFPNAKVICNDFDGQKERFDNFNETLKDWEFLNTLLKGYKAYEKIKPVDCDKIRDYLKARKASGKFVDWLTIGAWILHSAQFMSEDNIFKSTMYKCISTSKPTISVNFSDIEIIKKDYLEVINDYKDLKNVVFIADPPYLSTDKDNYNQSNFWGITRSCKIPYLLGDKFIYYEGERSEIIELCQLIEDLGGKESPFKGCKKIEYTCRCKTKRKEFLIFKNDNDYE